MVGLACGECEVVSARRSELSERGHSVRSVLPRFVDFQGCEGSSKLVSICIQLISAIYYVEMCMNDEN